MSIHHTVLAFFALAVGISAYSQEAVKRQIPLGRDSMPSGVAGALMAPGTDTTGKDIAAAIMAVQISRANALERQLKAEMDAVAKRNNDIVILNNVLRAAVQLRRELPNVAGPNAATPNGANKTMLANASKEVGKTDHRLQQLQTIGQAATTMTMGSSALTYGTKAELDNSIAKVKLKIDELSGSQQMDMLRLQSLSNKRNEEFEIMKNLINKKTQEDQKLEASMESLPYNNYYRNR